MLQIVITAIYEKWATIAINITQKVNQYEQYERKKSAARTKTRHKETTEIH